MNLSWDQICARCPLAVIGGANTDLGKTTFAKFLRDALIEMGIDARHIMIDAAEAPQDGEDLRLNATEGDFKYLMTELNATGDGQIAILDLGGHAFEKFMAQARTFGNTIHSDIQTFVIPVMANVKEEAILATIRQYIKLGVPPSKMAIVFNRISGDEEVEKMQTNFPILHEAAITIGYRICREPIYNWTIVSEARGSSVNIYDLASQDRADLKRQLREARADADEFERLNAALVRRDQAVGPADNFRRVFEEVLG